MWTYATLAFSLAVHTSVRDTAPAPTLLTSRAPVAPRTPGAPFVGGARAQPQRGRNRAYLPPFAPHSPTPTPTPSPLHSPASSSLTMATQDTSQLPTPQLYTSARTRGSLVEWYLDEIGAPYEAVNIDMKGGEQHSAAFKAINPFGKLPGLVDRNNDSNSGGTAGTASGGADGQSSAPSPPDWSLFESGALLQYLGERFDPNYPRTEDVRGRAEVTQWVLFANSTLAQALMSTQARESQLDGVMRALDAHFARRQFVIDESGARGGGDGTFGAADVAVGGYLSFATSMFGVDLSPYPNVDAYVKRITSRAGFQRHVGGGGG